PRYRIEVDLVSLEVEVLGLAVPDLPKLDADAKVSRDSLSPIITAGTALVDDRHEQRHPGGGRIDLDLDLAPEFDSFRHWKLSFANKGVFRLGPVVQTGPSHLISDRNVLHASIKTLDFTNSQLARVHQILDGHDQLDGLAAHPKRAL